MASILLHHHGMPNDPRYMKIMVCSKINNINVTRPENWSMAITETPEFLSKFPLGKVPACELENGETLTESNAIVRYIAGLRKDTNLLGSTYFQSGLVDQWLYWTTNELEAAFAGWIYPIFGFREFNKNVYESCKAKVSACLKTLDEHLVNKTYLVGERMTLADINVAAHLQALVRLVIVPAEREKYTNTMRWLLTILNHPVFLEVNGPVVLATEELKAQPPAKKEEPKKEVKKEEKKEEKPKADKKKKEDDDEDFDDTPKDEKPRLSEEEAKWIAAKSTMDLDTVKRTFSNNKYEDVAADFWKDFDYSLYTCWEANYKYNDENVIGWQTGNLVGGVLNRLEEARKIAYGSLVFTALDGVKPFHIQGFFMFKYKAVPTFVTDSADYDSFDYKQVDITTDAGKARMAEFWAADKIDGRLVQERRWLK